MELLYNNGTYHLVLGGLIFMLKFSFIVSSIGLVLSLIVHTFALLCAFFEYDSLTASNMIVLLIVIVILMFISALPLLKEMIYNDGLTERIKEEDKLWLYVLSMALPIYCIGMFILSIILNKHGSPQILNGQYVLAYKGELIEVLTKSEYTKQIFYTFIVMTSIMIVLNSSILIDLYFKIKDEVLSSYS